MKMSEETFNQLYVEMLQRREKEVADRRDGDRRRHTMMAEYRDSGKTPREFRDAYLEQVVIKRPELLQRFADEELGHNHVDTALRRCFRMIFDKSTWAGQE